MNKATSIMMDDVPRTSTLIALSHMLMRRALVALLREERPDWTCEDAGGLDALRFSLATAAHALVLVDTGLCPPDALRGLCAMFPGTRFVILSEQDDRASILACLEAGAQGFIPHSTAPRQFIRALETILMGGLFAPASLSGMPIHPPAPPQKQDIALSPALSHLTERQRDVFELLAEGCATKTIARRLDLAVGTVKVHLASIYRTLGASSRLEALAKAHRAHALA